MTKTEQRQETKTRVRNAPLYRVLIHNDEVTTWKFVVENVLVGVFRKNANDALRIAAEAHENGVALVVVLPLEQAEFRIDQSHSLARARKYPLTLTCEPE